jgi:ParB-like chromosome segregation protein Spo0J
VETVALSELQPAVDTPRLTGEDLAHVHMLADSDAELPPILVDRETRRVIDGAHRLKAAALRGADTIDVVYFDGDAEAAFVAAVEANTTHGLPLSLADRKSAAARILRSYPGWSDRAVARVTGLAARTVATIRRPTGDLQHLDRRVGRDGRVRPVNGSDSRRRVADMLRLHPDASLRQIARAAGVSPTTVRDVRDRLSRGEQPADRPERPAAGDGAIVKLTRSIRHKSDLVADPVTILHNLRRDPSLRHTETGRALLRGLEAQVRGFVACRRAAQQVPPHSAYALIGFARALAGRWLIAADEFEQFVEEDGETSG